MTWKHSPRSYLWFFLAIAAATVCKVSLASFTYGTNDAFMWESSAQLIRDGHQDFIYERKVDVFDPEGDLFYPEIFNHPPFMVFVLSGLNRIRDSMGMPVHVSLRLLDAAADTGSLVMTLEILESSVGAVSQASMILIALSPAWIFISGFHANTDPLMLFFLLLTVWLIEVHHRNGWGAASFAIATGIKIVPVLLLPALLLYHQTWKDRIRAIGFLAVFWLVTAFQWLVVSPGALWRNIAGYGSVTGHWGIGWMIQRVRFYTACPRNYSTTMGVTGWLSRLWQSR